MMVRHVTAIDGARRRRLQFEYAENADTVVPRRIYVHVFFQKRESEISVCYLVILELLFKVGQFFSAPFV